jgi:putative tricarboxylic transport membrane protein
VTKRWAEVAFAAIVITVAAATFWGTRNVAPPSFEPLGSAAFPRLVAACVAVMSLLILVRALRGRREAPDERAISRRGALVTAATLGLAALYAATMAAGLLSYRVATPLFVIASGTLLKGARLRTLLALAALGLVLGVGGHFVATHVVVIDLP